MGLRGMKPKWVKLKINIWSEKVWIDDAESLLETENKIKTIPEIQNIITEKRKKVEDSKTDDEKLEKEIKSDFD